MRLISLGLEITEKRSNPLNNRAIPLTAGAAIGWLNGGGVSEAGEVVTEETVLAISTAYARIRVLSESVATLPCKVYRLTDKGRTQANDHRLSYLLGSCPNPENTAITFFELLVKSLALCGNCFAQIVRDEDGQPLELWTLNPRLVQPVRLEDGELAYRVGNPVSGGGTYNVPAANMIHCPLFPAFDGGIMGLSPVQLSMSTFGQIRAAEKFGSRYFRNYATPSLAIKVPEEVDPKTKAEMRGLGIDAVGWQRSSRGRSRPGHVA